MTTSSPQPQAGNQQALSAWQRLRQSGVFRWLNILFLPAVALLAAVIFVRDGAKLLSQPIHLNFWLVGLSFTISFSGLFITIAIWRLILASYGIHQRTADDLRIYGYSTLALVLPGGFWPIVSRTTQYERLGVKSLPVATASVVETLVLGVASMTLYALVTLVRPELSFWKRPEIGLLVTLAALTLIQPGVFNRLVNWVLKKTNSSIPPLQDRFGLKHLAVWILMEMTVVSIGGCALFVLLQSLTPASPALFPAVVAAWAASSAAGSLFVWVPGSAILRDGVMVLALSPSLPLPVALVFVILVRVWSMASLLLFAGLFWVIFDLPKLFKRRQCIK